MGDAQRAARLTDPICHSLGIVGLIGGALLGAAVGAFMILTLPASAPLLAAALVGAAAAGAIGGGALAGEQLMHGIQTAFGLPDPVTGLIGIVGSTNVLIGGLPAVRTVLDMAIPCNGLFSTHHFPIPSAPPAPIAEGSATVLINGQQAARVTSKIVCGAVIQDGCATVLIGGPTKRVLAVHDFEDTLHNFFADVMKVSLWAMAGITAVAGIGPLVVFGLTVGAFYVANETLGMLGDQLGPGWRDILQGGFGLGAIVVGGKAAEEPRANPLNYRLEAEPNTLGSNFGNARLEYTPPEGTKAAGVQKWADQFATKQTPNNGDPRNTYEIRQTGPVNTEVRGGNEKIWADGIDAAHGQLQEAKYIADPAKSPYVDGSRVPDFIREPVRNDFENEVRRYGAIINDPNTPVTGLQVITNEPQAVPYFQSVLQKYSVPGSVVVKP